MASIGIKQGIRNGIWSLQEHCKSVDLMQVIIMYMHH
jgi:hypothetical protein